MEDIEQVNEDDSVSPRDWKERELVEEYIDAHRHNWTMHEEAEYWIEKIAVLNQKREEEVEKWIKENNNTGDYYLEGYVDEDKLLALLKGEETK